MSTVNISMVKFIDFLAGLAVFAAAAASAATTTADGIVVAISLTAVCL